MLENAVVLVGDLTADPELRLTRGSGLPVVSFTVAVTEWQPTGDGQAAEDEAVFIRCSAWQALGENVAESLRKGQRVIVAGRLRQQGPSTVLELDVDAIGPELHWQRAQVSKVPRATWRNSPPQPHLGPPQEPPF